MSYALGQTPAASTTPVPTTNWPAVLGWVGLIGMSGAILWGAVTMPPARVRANRRRSRRRNRRSRPTANSGRGASRYLHTFFAEKDLPNVSFEVRSPNGTANWMDTETVIEAIYQAPPSEQTKIADMLRRIDFANGKVQPFLEHLAKALAHDLNNNSARRSVRRNASPPPLYQAVGVDSSGHRTPLGSGPLSRMRDTAMAHWLGGMPRVYVLDRAGHSHLTLEPRDRRTLTHNAKLGHAARGSVRSKHLGTARLAWAPQWRFKKGGSTGVAHGWVSRNPRGRLGGTKEMALWEAMELARQHPVADQGAWSILSPAAKAKIKALPDGFYSYGMGKAGAALRGYKTGDLSGVMTSTRIAASKSHEPHWLFQVRKHHPVVIRMFDDNGRSVYRVEEFAKVSQAVAVPVRARRSRSASARR